MKIRGRAWTFGDDVNTDDIIPARYLSMTDPAALAAHCMEDADPAFASKVRPGDLIVAGSNFGCGSSREHAPIAIRGAGVGAVIAASFARIFYRNAFNTGLPIFECAEAAGRIGAGDEVEIDTRTGGIRNVTRDETYATSPIPPFMEDLVRAGGLMAYLRERIASGRAPREGR
ncbi:MAG: 3-isopropylmalate dehydratase small subunit [bacterium]|nr:3-isopropylmalate dehydratase small subunit [bacterium]